MEIVNYFKSAGFKDATDKTLALARKLEDLNLKIREVKAELLQKVSVSVDGKDLEVIKGPGAETLHKEMQRWQKQKDEVMEKIEKIEKYSAERETFSCPSEAVHAQHRQQIAKSTLDVEANALVDRTIKKYKNCIPAMIEHSLKDDPNILDSGEQLKRGCIIESNKLRKMKSEIDAEQIKIDNWLAYRDEILEFISKVCPDDAN